MKKMGQAVAMLALLMVLLTFVIVVLRYFFNAGWIWLQELVLYMHAVLFMLGFSFTLLHNEHVRVDVFYERLSAKRKYLIDQLGTWLLTLPCCVGFFWVSLDYVGFSWSVREHSSETGGLPAVYWLKSLLLLSPLLFLLAAWVFLRFRKRQLLERPDL